MRFAVGNRSEKTISGYWITASEIWKTEGKSGAKDLDWTAFEILEPGDTSTISLPGNAEGSSLRVAKVTFRDGSTWINPRVSAVVLKARKGTKALNGSRTLCD